MNDARYPIGRFEPPSEMDSAARAARIDIIAAAPLRLREALAGLSETQLGTPYRDGGWTVRQVAHHLPDSHLNGYVRTKLALTESEPTIKPYDEAAWADLADSRVTPVETSLVLLESVHARWCDVWRSLDATDFGRTFRHPEHGVVTLDWHLAMYAWHSRHHVGHITALRERMHW